MDVKLAIVRIARYVRELPSSEEKDCIIELCRALWAKEKVSNDSNCHDDIGAD